MRARTPHPATPHNPSEVAPIHRQRGAKCEATLPNHKRPLLLQKQPKPPIARAYRQKPSNPLYCWHCGHPCLQQPCRSCLVKEKALTKAATESRFRKGQTPSQPRVRSAAHLGHRLLSQLLGDGQEKQDRDCVSWSWCGKLTTAQKDSLARYMERMESKQLPNHPEGRYYIYDRGMLWLNVCLPHKAGDWCTICASDYGQGSSGAASSTSAFVADEDCQVAEMGGVA